MKGGVIVPTLLLALASAVVNGDMDQFLSQSPHTYKIRSTGAWQTFRPAWSGNLTQIHLKLGASIPASPCVPFSGTLFLYDGPGNRQLSPGSHFSGMTPLHTQAVSSTSCQCSTTNCLSWQQWTLTSLVPVWMGREYSIFISRDNAGTSMRLGLQPYDFYLRGANHFRSAGYDFSFRTFLLESNPANSNPGGSSSGDKAVVAGASSSIVAVIAVVAVIVVSAAVFVGIIYRRRVQQSKWLSTEQALSELRAAVGVAGPDASSDPSDGPYLKMDVDDQDYIVDGLDVIAETPLTNNWVIAETPAARPRLETGSSLMWRSRQAVALPEAPATIPAPSVSVARVSPAPVSDEHVVDGLDVLTETSLDGSWGINSSAPRQPVSSRSQQYVVPSVLAPTTIPAPVTRVSLASSSDEHVVDGLDMLTETSLDSAWGIPKPSAPRRRVESGSASVWRSRQSVALPNVADTPADTVSVTDVELPIEDRDYSEDGVFAETDLKFLPASSGMVNQYPVE